MPESRNEDEMSKDFEETETEEGMKRLKIWQRVLLALLVVGYGGYYLCRVHFSVTKSLLLEEFGRGGIHDIGLDTTVLGSIGMWGLIAYAAGKFINGALSDYFGGKRMFLIGMGGAILFSILFGMSGSIPIFTLCIIGNRFIQSTGWVGMTRLASRWFSYKAYGATMGIISLSYLFGDFLSRLFLGQLLQWHFGWRSLFFAAAGVLALIFVVCLIFVRESPQEANAPEPLANPENFYGRGGNETEPGNFLSQITPLIRRPSFWVICALCFGFTMTRETVNSWAPLYLTEVTKMSKGVAAQISSLFPLFGGISVLICGWMSDKLGKNARSLIIIVGLFLSTFALYALGRLSTGGSQWVPIVALAGAGFLLLGPYSFLAGSISLDFGGKKGSATAAGWIDGIGYIGGILSEKYIGEIAKHSGWNVAFMTLVTITTLTLAVAVAGFGGEALAKRNSSGKIGESTSDV